MQICLSIGYLDLSDTPTAFASHVLHCDIRDSAEAGTFAETANGEAVATIAVDVFSIDKEST